MTAELGRSPLNPATPHTAALLAATGLIRARLREDPVALTATALAIAHRASTDVVVRTLADVAIIAGTALCATDDTATALEIVDRLKNRAKFRQVVGPQFPDP